MSDAPHERPRTERLPFESGLRRPRYQIVFEGSGGRMDVHDLRMILKRLLRDRGLKCIEAREL